MTFNSVGASLIRGFNYNPDGEGYSSDQEKSLVFNSPFAAHEGASAAPVTQWDKFRETHFDKRSVDCNSELSESQNSELEEIDEKRSLDFVLDKEEKEEVKHSSINFQKEGMGDEEPNCKRAAFKDYMATEWGNAFLDHEVKDSSKTANDYRDLQTSQKREEEMERFFDLFKLSVIEDSSKTEPFEVRKKGRTGSYKFSATSKPKEVPKFSAPTKLEQVPKFVGFSIQPGSFNFSANKTKEVVNGTLESMDVASGYVPSDDEL